MIIPLPFLMISYSLYNYVFVFSVTSSEKVDKAQRYADFTLLSVPYPGIDLLHADNILKTISLLFYLFNGSNVA